MNWNPEPLDLSDVNLGDKGDDILEKIAENIHNVWAKGRIDDGWKYGPNRNDIEKETPCLVPYDKLPESEKEYDRRTACEAIKSAIKLGFVQIK